MAELTSFAFRPGNTVLHRLDVRFKLFLMVLISLSTVHAAVPALLMLSFVFTILARRLRISVIDAIKELRYFLILLALVFLARIFSTAGDPLLNIGFMVVTRPGIHQAILVCWRLLVVVCLGICFVASTRITHMKWAVEWFLRPIPLIPEKRIATMMGLIVRFIPVIFQKTLEVSQAQKARCSQSIKNPFKRIKRLAFPLVRRVFQDAENVAAAMAARCYRETSTRIRITPCRQDWLILAIGSTLALTVFLL